MELSCLNIFTYPGKRIKEFINYYRQIENYTLNPKSRLFTIYDFSKKYLKHETTFIEVGCWKGGIWLSCLSK